MSKGSPQKEYFFEDTCFTRKICKYRFKKKIGFEIPRICDLENLFAFYKKSCQCCHENGGGILQHFIYLHNKNVLQSYIEYAQIAWSGPKSMICYIEGLFLTWEKFWEHILPNLQNLLYLDLTLIDINQSHTISYHGDHWNNLYRKAIVQWSAWLVILVFQEYSSWIADEVMYWKIDRYCSTSQQCQPRIQKSHEKKNQNFLSFGN